MRTVQENTELFRKLQSALNEDKVLYNAFVASIESALKEVPAGTGLYNVAQMVADRIIGRENDAKRMDSTI